MPVLAVNVHAGGRWWGPDYDNAGQVPPEVSAEITNPACWVPEPQADETTTPAEAEAAQAAIEAEMRAAADPPPAIEDTKASLAASFDRLGVSEAMAEVPGFEWLANPDAQAVLVDIDGVNLSLLDDPQGTPP